MRDITSGLDRTQILKIDIGSMEVLVAFSDFFFPFFLFICFGLLLSPILF